MSFIPARPLAGIALAAGVVLAGSAVVSAKPAPARHAPVAARTAGQIGPHRIRTVPVPAGVILRSASYTPSGKVLVNYAKPGESGRRLVNLATMNDDGTGLRPFFSAAVPERPKDNGIRFMIFPDNKRIFMGDFVLECATSLETCAKPVMVPVDYPAEVADGDYVGHRWSEMIVAPDNRHIAWTTLFSNYSGMVFTGELRRENGRYRIAAPNIVSTIEPFVKDPRHADGVLPAPARGGEVKQFVAGGRAISMVGAARRNTPDSVVVHLDNGRIDPVTDDPGYTETTIFSPDERLGVTMTTRFSPATNMAIAGLMPLPYPGNLNVGLAMLAYTHAVTGVRRDRPGNVGPALIDIRASQTRPGYQGINLNTAPDWVFNSPLSWHPSSKKAMWIEGRRSPGRDGERRIQVVELPAYRAGPPVAARPTPSPVPYGTTDMVAVRRYATQSTRNAEAKVYGRAAGYILFKRSGGVTEKTYVGFSDDGRQVYSGRERMEADPLGRSTYTADVRLSGPRPGRMDLKLTFGPLTGPSPAALIFERGPDGRPLTRGYAEYAGKRLEAAGLVP